MLNAFHGRVVPTVLAALICVGLGAQAVPAKADYPASTSQIEAATSGIAFESGASFLAMHTLLKAIGNAYERGAFTADEARLYAQQVVEAMGDAVRGVEALRQFENVNQNNVEELIRTFKMLGESAQALIRYTETGNPADRDAYLSYRDAAWTNLCLVIGQPQRQPAV